MYTVRCRHYVVVVVYIVIARRWKNLPKFIHYPSMCIVRLWWSRCMAGRFWPCISAHLVLNLQTTNWHLLIANYSLVWFWVIELTQFELLFITYNQASRELIASFGVLWVRTVQSVLHTTGGTVHHTPLFHFCKYHYSLCHYMYPLLNNHINSQNRFPTNEFNKHQPCLLWPNIIN